MDITSIRSIAEITAEEIMSAPLTWTAGAGQDDVQQTGLTIDLASFPTGSRPRSADVIIPFSATLAATKTLSITWTLQTSPDGSTWSTYASEAATVVATGPTGGATVTGVAHLTVVNSNAPGGAEQGVPLEGALRYIRLLYTPDLSNTGTDTATVFPLGVFGGFNQLDAP